MAVRRADEAGGSGAVRRAGRCGGSASPACRGLCDTAFPPAKSAFGVGLMGRRGAGKGARG